MELPLSKLLVVSSDSHWTSKHKTFPSYLFLYLIQYSNDCVCVLRVNILDIQGCANSHLLIYSIIAPSSSLLLYGLIFSMSANLNYHGIATP